MTFTPTAAISYGGPITVVSNANTTLGSFSASGTGVTAPAASLLTVEQNENPGPVPISDPLDCGTVFLNSGKTNPVATLLIQNPTNTALSISSITFPLGYSGTWTSQVPAGGASTLSLFFNPIAVKDLCGQHRRELRLRRIAADDPGHRNRRKARRRSRREPSPS